MTYREAINRLKSLEENTEGKVLFISNLKENREALRLGIQALEKQEPKKPIKYGTFYHTYHCPTCGSSVSDDETYSYNYCPNCGQTQDWSE